MRLGDYQRGHEVIREQGLRLAGSGDHPVKVVLVDILGGSVLGAISSMFAGPFGPLIALKLTGLRLYAMPDIGCPEVSALGHEAVSGVSVSEQATLAGLSGEVPRGSVRAVESNATARGLGHGR